MALKSDLPAKNEEYGTKDYCEEGGDYDWFKSYDQIAKIFEELISDRDKRILILGCGNSTLSAQMYDDGYRNIVNVDYSEVLIQDMQNRHGAARPEMEWHTMDIRSLNFDDSSFDVAIDKGTMDAMMTSKGDVWDPPEQVVEDCTREVDEVIRVLRKGTGKFLYLTFGQPHFRRRFLTRENTSLEIRELGDMFHYYLYVVRT